jgi:hypothetical protein
MKRALCTSLILCFATPVFACEQPSLPMIPAAQDIGRRTAAVERATQRYLEAMTAYVTCVQSEFNDAKQADPTSLHLELLVNRNNAAVAEFEAVTRLFEARVGPLESLDLQRIQSALAPTAQASAGTPAPEGFVDELATAAPERCISTASLDATKVVNDRTVLFYQRNGRIYLNLLKTACPELVRSGRFVFQVRGVGTPRLCDKDVIHAMDPFTGGYGVACNLDEFYEISEADAQALLDPRGSSNNPIRVEVVEFPAKEKAE